MEIYLCHMLIFRAVELLHLEKIILNEYILFFITCILVISMAIAFSYFTKKIINQLILVFQRHTYISH